MLNHNKHLPFIKTAGLLAFAVLLSCAVQQQPVTQGIKGYIYRVSGNQMPMKGRPVTAKGKGIAAEVWIYAATTPQQARGRMPLFDIIPTRLAAKVRADSTGFYQAALPAGTYSVFVKQGNQFFAAETNGAGVLNPVEVATSNVSTRNVTVNTGAAY